MSRLDDHVGLVRVKLTFATFVRLVPWALAIFGAAAFLAILVNQITRYHLPRPHIWFWIGIGTAVVVPLVYAIVHRPTRRQAAVAIDERLGLKEKFSTALYVRSSNDPFAAAAVMDAEAAAAGADLHNKFPIAFPVAGTVFLVAAAIVAFLTTLITPGDRFASADASTTKINIPQIDRTDPRIRVQQALAEIDRAPREVSETETIRNAKKDLTEILKKPITDPPAARERAEDALKRIEAIKQKIAAAQQYVTATNEMNILKNVGMPSPSDTGPVSDAHRAFANGNLEEAAEDLKNVVKNFDKMSQAEKDKAADQMKKLANQIAQKADDPKVQQQIKDQLQQAGVDQKKAEEIAKKMQEAANGVPDAAKQAQQMVNQAIQNANQNAGNKSPQQQQAAANQIKQAANKAQQQANGQASAQQMAQTAKALSQSMQQAAAQSKGSQGAKGQQAQASGQKGQQGGQAGQAGQQGQAQQGAQAQNGQGSGQPGGAGQSAQQQMQQQVGQLQAMAKDAQATNAGQQMAQGAGTGQQQGQQGGSGQGQAMGQGQAGNGQQPGGQQGQQGQGQQGQGGGQNGGIAAGGIRPDPIAAPFQTVQELSKSQTIESGQIIANSFVKAPSERGESKVKLTQAIEAKAKGEDGEVTTYRIPRGAQKAVKDYFDTLKQDAPAK